VIVRPAIVIEISLALDVDPYLLRSDGRPSGAQIRQLLDDLLDEISGIGGCFGDVMHCRPVAVTATLAPEASDDPAE
jgi:hypothetical protein